jgi:hypothetical protein
MEGPLRAYYIKTLWYVLNVHNLTTGGQREEEDTQERSYSKGQ